MTRESLEHDTGVSMEEINNRIYAIISCCTLSGCKAEQLTITSTDDEAVIVATQAAAHNAMPFLGEQVLCYVLPPLESVQIHALNNS